jgi:hypothetical protein
MPLSPYEEFCKQIFKEGPRRSAIDRVVRERPVRMRQAIGDYIAAPAAIAGTPTIIFDVKNPAAAFESRRSIGFAV